ncbi:porphobilinogen deaminase, dipyromethane cofactor binding domain-containing protein [Hygrophoropsis aurantiaca]|uniref:Porphobilinogen deaminase, dipyromethane cofactor binding domain-containing protein n=1 Tax=Hygrophoropsis aurantiaca TaxID=72124 RepID=A0ACB8A555_9AGAM|nr:porphobilinogen deaminase, dipyromethane cofactor binding domain-containing protein [Hygrophoropsis aurantiaca]
MASGIGSQSTSTSSPTTIDFSKSKPRTFVLASRASKLAQIQTNIVRDALEAAFPALSFGTSFMSTEGDKNQSQALYLLGGKALWTKELEVALKENLVDMLVHSFKDVPTTLPDGCEIGAILEREDPVDSLVVKQGLPFTDLVSLPDGSVVGTSSVRRVAQLRRQYPKLVFLDVRGNLNTRLAKLDAPDGPYTALILAKAGLVRLGLGDRITADLKGPILYHAVSQGALAVEIRSNDQDARELCRALTHPETQWKCLAERAMLRVLEGGCSVPVGVESELTEVERDEGGLKSARLTIFGCVTSIDGVGHVSHKMDERVESAKQAEEAGEKLARWLRDNGAAAILDAITEDRQKHAEEATT